MDVTSSNFFLYSLKEKADTDFKDDICGRSQYFEGHSEMDQSIDWLTLNLWL